MPSWSERYEERWNYRSEPKPVRKVILFTLESVIVGIILIAWVAVIPELLIRLLTGRW